MEWGQSNAHWSLTCVTRFSWVSENCARISLGFLMSQNVTVPSEPATTILSTVSRQFSSALSASLSLDSSLAVTSDSSCSSHFNLACKTNGRLCISYKTCELGARLVLRFDGYHLNMERDFVKALQQKILYEGFAGTCQLCSQRGYMLILWFAEGIWWKCLCRECNVIGAHSREHTLADVDQALTHPSRLHEKSLLGWLESKLTAVTAFPCNLCWLSSLSPFWASNTKTSEEAEATPIRLWLGCCARSVM